MPKTEQVQQQLVAWILGGASRQVQSVIAGLPDARVMLSAGEADKTMQGLFILFVAFNYHWVDRAAFQILRARRDPFMDELRDSLLDELVGSMVKQYSPRGTTDLVRKAIDERIDFTQHYFGQFDLPSDGKVTAGTLFWEFGKTVAEEVGAPGHAFVVGMGSIQAMSHIKAFYVPGALRRL